MLNKKAMLVNLSISQWGARKYDRATSAEIDATHGTADAGRYNKCLIAQAVIKTVSQVATTARTYHYTNTLPWNDNGARILPTSNYLEYTQEIKQHQSLFFAAVKDLVDNYPQLVADAQLNLKTLFNSDDYPAAGTIQDKYRFTVEIDPIPEATDFRIDINSDELKNLQAEIEQRTQQAQAAAMKDLYDRLFTAVNHAAETLKQPDKIFRDTLIGNLDELADLLPRLNLTGDPKLNELAQQVKTKLANQVPAELRTKEVIRAIAARDAAQILADMSAYMGS